MKTEPQALVLLHHDPVVLDHPNLCHNQDQPNHKKKTCMANVPNQQTDTVGHHEHYRHSRLHVFMHKMLNVHNS